MQIKQSSAAKALVFFMVDSAARPTGKTGLSPTVTLSKNGGSFGSPSGAVTEIGSGFYKVAANATDSNTLGMLALSATGSGADQAAMAWEIVAYDPDDAAALGLSRIDAAISSRNATAPDNAGIAAIKSKTDNLPASPAAVGSAMTLTSGERTAVANEVEVQIIDETDSEKVLTAITNKIAAVNPSLAGLTIGAIASGVRTELATELARVDVATSTRLATAGYTAPTNLSAATIAGAVRTELTVELGRIDAAVTTRLASGTYAAPDNAGIAAVKVVTDKLAGMLEVDGPVSRYTANALEQAPAGEGGPGGDPWLTEVPGSYADGTAGAALGRLNVLPPEQPVLVVPDPAGILANVSVSTADITGQATAGLIIKFRLSGKPSSSGVGVVQLPYAEMTTDENGLAAISLVRTDSMTPAGLQYEVTCLTLGLDKVPFSLESETFDLASLI